MMAGVCTSSRAAGAVPSVRNCGSLQDGKENALSLEEQDPSPPTHIVTKPSELPASFLQPHPDNQLVVGFDCEGVDLARHGRLCVIQLAFEDAVYLVDVVVGGKELVEACRPGLESNFVTKVIHDCKRDSEALYFQYGIKLQNIFDTQVAYTMLEKQGSSPLRSDHISFVELLADPRYCGVTYGEKESVRTLMRADPQFWTYRPWTPMMTRAAADDVRFMLTVHAMMAAKLSPAATWQLKYRSSLYARCFCWGAGEGETLEWPQVPVLTEEDREGQLASHDEALAVVDVPPGMMGRVIGKKGASIRSLKESCQADVFTGGNKGPPDKVFVVGPRREVQKVEAIVRGKFY